MSRSESGSDNSQLDHAEKGSLDTDAPGCDWPCGAQDGFNLFIQAYAHVFLRLKDPNAISTGGHRHGGQHREPYRERRRR